MTTRLTIAAPLALEAEAQKHMQLLQADTLVSGVLPPAPPFLSAQRRTLAVYLQGDNSTLGAALAARFNALSEGRYAALHVYYEPTPAADALLRQIADAICEMTGAALLAPHSLADLPGDAQGLRPGVHFQFIAPETLPYELHGPLLPDAVLRHLRSCADHQTLREHGQELVRIDLGPSLKDGLARTLRTIHEMRPDGAEPQAAGRHPRWIWESRHLPPTLSLPIT